MFETDANPSSILAINSWHFLLLALTAILGFRLAPRSWMRGALLACVNLYFASYFLNTLPVVAIVGGLLFATYVAGEVRARWEDSLPVWPFTLCVLTLWVMLFLVKDPSLFPAANPFHWLAVRIVGISYLMFRCINYVSDAAVLPSRNPMTFFNYMLFFPTFLAGPIERYDNFQEEYDRAPESNPAVLPILHRIANGLLKKFVLADNLLALAVFSLPEVEHATVAMLWVGVLLQLLLLFLDFSGYCDIVIGVGQLMGVKVMENFNNPFAATNIQEFWNRWHISLTSFLRDYVFNPLNYLIVRHSWPRWQVALTMLVYMFTMLLVALWHGTSWGFLAFGLLHGGALVAYQLYRQWIASRYPPRVDKFLRESSLANQAGRLLTYTFCACSMTFWNFGVVGALAIFLRMLGI